MYSIEDIQNYKIYMLGPSGSGKTVFLASLYDRLTIPDPNLGFFLRTSNPQKRDRLNKAYAQITNPKADWPAGTDYADISTWEFICYVEAGGSHYKAQQFTYVDYAGGRLIEAQDSGVLEESLKEADVLLGLLDGLSILKLMRGEPARGNTFFQDLKTILQIMQESGKPVHFVITKWDLLHKYFSLSQVSTRLLEEPLFQRFVRWRNSTGAIIRLIPVSAVGFDFVEPRKNSDGSWSMRKESKGVAHPFQVEMPLVCALPDKFQARREHLSQAWAEIANQPNWTYRERLLRLATISVVAVELLIGLITPLFWPGWFSATYLFQQSVFKEIKDYLNKERETTSILQREQELHEEMSQREVEDEQTALLHTVKSFLLLVEKLETDLPASRL